jgi:DNA N-6-adenine-methyltransferase (Dam)
VTLAGYRFNNDVRYRGEDHPSQTQFTPDYVLVPVRAALGGTIGLDPCTTEDNPVGAARFYCPPADGGALDWDAETIFVNPPYGKVREHWVQRCADAGMRGSQVILLMPAATDTLIFQQALATANEVLFIQGRVKFGTLRPNRRQVAASHPSALLSWNALLEECSYLGTRLKIRG